MEVTAPEISVIIPTFRRSRLVPAAIDSVLRQTAVDLELLVVIDGPDPETQRALASIADSRLRVVQLPRTMGPAEARNQGVQNARGKWIAFLDDDDTWFPTKLEAQLRTAHAASVPLPVVTCRVLARSEQAVHCWPRRRPAPGEPLGEYLFCRSTFFSGEGMVQTSTWFVPRELLARHPFNPDLPAMCDVEWLLRVTRDPRVQLLFVPVQEPLATWNIETGRERISNGIRWKFQLDWARTYRALLTSRAYAGLLLTWSGNTAARDRDWSAFFKLPAAAFREGTPSPQEVLTYLGYWLIPRRLSGKLSGWFAHLHRLWTDSH